MQARKCHPQLLVDLDESFSLAPRTSRRPLGLRMEGRSYYPTIYSDLDKVWTSFSNLHLHISRSSRYQVRLLRIMLVS
ncbi:hypothetical protein REMIM1_PE00196 (plasmid) [Rhizobium etli bv. mimosae str. Mim1]|nr:hypothetical protein REMIM1_PE00196 [Rhizobium etli bv. mimosae str. Mim1]